MLITGIILLFFSAILIIYSIMNGGFLGESFTGFLLITCLGLVFLIAGIFKRKK